MVVQLPPGGTPDEEHPTCTRCGRELPGPPKRKCAQCQLEEASKK